MQFTFTEQVICGLTIPDGKSLTIGNFTFIPDFEGERMARHIQTVVEAQTKEEAQIRAKKIFSDFLATLTLVDNSKYSLGDDVSITAAGSDITTHTKSLSMKVCIARDGNRVKNAYESSPKMGCIRKLPMGLYRDGINTDDPFDKFRNFYRVLECYGTTGRITTWVLSHIPNTEMKKNNRGQNITVYTWIRIKLSHSKKSP